MRRQESEWVNMSDYKREWCPTSLLSVWSRAQGKLATEQALKINNTTFPGFDLPHSNHPPVPPSTRSRARPPRPHPKPAPGAHDPPTSLSHRLPEARILPSLRRARTFPEGPLDVAVTSGPP